jgi:hypothetical protein
MRRILLSLASAGMLLLSMASAGYSETMSSSDTATAFGDSVYARIMDYGGQIRLTGTQDKTVTLGQTLCHRDTMKINADGYCILLFTDGTIRKFEGQATVYFESPEPTGQRSFLQKLATSMVDVFFSKGEAGGESQLGTRDLEGFDVIDRIPRLVYPPAETVLAEPPAYLKWRPVEGVTDYSVSLYEGNHLLIAESISDTALKIKAADYPLKRGVEYSWRVKAMVGDSCLRSKPEIFRIADENLLSELDDRLAEIAGSLNDSRLVGLMSAQLYRDMGLKLKCYSELESVLAAYPNDLVALKAKAEILHDMGHIEEALAVYRSALIR